MELHHLDNYKIILEKAKEGNIGKRAKFRLEFLSRNQKISEIAREFAALRDLSKRRNKEGNFEKKIETFRALIKEELDDRDLWKGLTFFFTTLYYLNEFKKPEFNFARAGLLMGLTSIEIVHIKDRNIIGNEMITTPYYPLGDFLLALKGYDPDEDPSIFKNLTQPVIYGVNKHESSIHIKIHLDRNRQEIIQEVGALLNVLDKTINLRRLRPRFHEYPKLLKVYDLRRKNPKVWTFPKIAKKLLPKYFQGLKPEPALACTLVKKWNRQAKKMIENYKCLKL